MNLITEFDAELLFLERSLTALEISLNEIMVRIKSEDCDPDSSGLLDQGDFLIGLGFTVCQRYITGTLGWIKTSGKDISKKKALDVGNIVKNNITYVAAINAGANYWKHSDEWDLIYYENEEKKLPPQVISTMETVGEITDSPYYIYSNLLYELTKTKNIKLTDLIPIMKSWREQLVAIIYNNG